MKDKEELLKRIRQLHTLKREIQLFIEDLNKELDEIEQSDASKQL